MSLRNLITSLLVVSFSASGVIAQSVSLEPMTGFHGNYVLPGQPIEIGVRITTEATSLCSMYNHFTVWTAMNGSYTSAFDTADVAFIHGMGDLDTYTYNVGADGLGKDTVSIMAAPWWGGVSRLSARGL